MNNTLTFGEMSDKAVRNIIERTAEKTNKASDKLAQLKKSLLSDLQSLVHAFPNDSFSFKELVENDRFNDYMGGTLDYTYVQTDPHKDPRPVHRLFIDDHRLFFNLSDEFNLPADMLTVEWLCLLLSSLHDFCHGYFEYQQQEDLGLNVFENEEALFEI